LKKTNFIFIDLQLLMRIKDHNDILYIFAHAISRWLSGYGYSCRWNRSFF